MKSLVKRRASAVGIALVAALLLMAAVQTASSSAARTGTRAVVALRTTGIGSVLVDSHGRTVYLFEKDRSGLSMCNSACVKFWPRLTSHGNPHAGKGVHQSLLGLGRVRRGVGQVTYAGHPLYTFVGDKRPGQTSGEGLDNFGAEWYAVGPNGHKVEHDKSGSSSSTGGYPSSGSGW
jgi:predicted lipoprotein with Yx(FWY)xxD motif